MGRLGGIGPLGQCTERDEHFHITDIASEIEHRQESNKVYASFSLLESSSFNIFHLWHART